MLKFEACQGSAKVHILVVEKWSASPNRTHQVTLSEKTWTKDCSSIDDETSLWGKFFAFFFIELFTGTAKYVIKVVVKEALMNTFFVLALMCVKHILYHVENHTWKK